MSNRYYLEDEFIVDGEAECAYDDIIHNPLELLNEQDQRIAELEKENEELKQQLAEQVKTVNIERIETFDNRKGGRVMTSDYNSKRRQ